MGPRGPPGVSGARDLKDSRVLLANLVSPDLLDLLVSWDQLDHQDVKEKMVKTESPEILVLWELLDLRVFADSPETQELLEPRDTEVFLVYLVKRETPEVLEPTENLVMLVNLVHLVFKDLVDHLVIVVDLDLLDLQALEDQMELLDNLD